MKNLTILFLSIIFSINNLYSQSAAKAIRTNIAPEIDGIIGDNEWNNAFEINQFVQREPNIGETVSEKTVVFVCYDNNFLYFAFKCSDDPSKITAKEMARDVSLANDDRVQIILDTFHDSRNGYWFQIGPRGSIGDALVSENGTSMNKEWDGLWIGKSSINNDGWEAEIAIPFKTLGFDPDKSVWGLKLIRHIRRKLESSYWPVANINSHKFQISDAGLFEGVEGISQGIGLDLSPYLAGGMNSQRGEKEKYKIDGGFDMFYQITSSLKAALSVNTDFAETEVDDRQINLTRFSLHFPEKRDFFLDGSNYFKFGIEGDDNNLYKNSISPFFSRRLGLDNAGNMLPVRYAAKITGQQKAMNIGVMYVSDERQYGNSNLSVARISHNIGKQSSIGAIGTWGNAISTDRNIVGGLDLKLATAKFNGNKNLVFTLFGLISDTENKSGKTSSWGTDISYPNDFFSFGLGHYQIGENFTAGIGFVPRTNIKASYGSFSFGPRPDKFGILQVKSGAGFNYITDFYDNIVTRDLKLSVLGIRFKSGEEFSWTVNQQFELLKNNFAIFPGFVIPKDEYIFWRQNFQIASAGSKNFAGIANYGFGDFYDGKREDISLALNYKVAVPLFIGTKFSLNNVSLPSGDFSAKIVQFNLNLLFSPEITLYNYVQYDNATEKLGWQSRFQWILKPGNEIILAWTSGWSQPLENWVLNESALRFKIKYNIRF